MSVSQSISWLVRQVTLSNFCFHESFFDTALLPKYVNTLFITAAAYLHMTRSALFLNVPYNLLIVVVLVTIVGISLCSKKQGRF